MSVFTRLRERFTRRAPDGRPKAIALIAILFRNVGTAVVGIAGIVVLVSVSFQAGAPGPENPTGSGIIVRTEVTALWIPRALHDVAQSEAGAPVLLSPAELHTEMKRRGLNDAWYALTYRGHQVNGEFEEITQIRRLSEAADHLDEFQDMMATVAGRPPRYEGGDYSHARVEFIPDTLQAVDPRDAVTRLMAEPVMGGRSSPTGGLNSARRP
jgi:hypothetical protein